MSLLSLTIMEIVLGIDNIIFISILCGRLPHTQERNARLLGLGLALFLRIGLLFLLNWLANLHISLFSIQDIDFSYRDIILMAGGLFLIYKSTSEIHEKLEGKEESETESKRSLSFWTVIFQILILDVVFSFDSILTAIGLGKSIWIMIVAVVISVFIMMLAAGKISDFINAHPTVKMLALAFLLMIGVLLFVEGFDVEVPKGYVYFAIFFSLFVEMLNLRAKKNSKAVELKQRYKEEGEEK